MILEILLFYILGLPGGTSDKEPSCQYRRQKRQGLDWEDSLEVGMATHSSLENSMGRGVWWAIVCGVANLDMTEVT